MRGQRPGPVVDPDRGHRQAVVLHLRLRRDRRTPCSAPRSCGRSGAGRARFAVIVADVWKTTPFIALLILAGLQIIPEEVVRGGQDGRCHQWQRVHPDHPAAGEAGADGGDPVRGWTCCGSSTCPTSSTGGANNTHHAVDPGRQPDPAGFNSAAALSTDHLRVHLPGRLRLREGPGSERGPDPPVEAEGRMRWHQTTTVEPHPDRGRRRQRGARGGVPGRRWLATTASRLIVVCLAPFYWMIVMSFRDVASPSTRPRGSPTDTGQLPDRVQTPPGQPLRPRAGQQCLIIGSARRRRPHVRRARGVRPCPAAVPR